MNFLSPKKIQLSRVEKRKETEECVKESSREASPEPESRRDQETSLLEMYELYSQIIPECKALHLRSCP